MKSAVVTGGTRGIGKSICERLLEDGYRVYAIYCENDAAAEQFTAEASDPLLSVHRCDISDGSAVSLLFEEIGSVDVLINNAGIADINLLTDLSDERIEKIISVNLTGAIFCSKAALRSMVRNKCGSIVNISSMWGDVGASCEVVYSAAKAGLSGFTKALAKEVGLSGIRVNCVSAGVINTQMNASLGEEALRELREEIPLYRLGETGDVADAVMFLISDKAKFITGEILKVNGGMVV